MVNPNSWAINGQGTKVYQANDCVNGLDHAQFYMPGSPWQCNLTALQKFNDSPAIGGFQSGAPGGGHLEAALVAYVMYTPPPSASGRGVMTVPLLSVIWQVKGDAVPGAPWTIANESESISANQSGNLWSIWPTFPHWTLIH